MSPRLKDKLLELAIVFAFAVIFIAGPASRALQSAQKDAELRAVHALGDAAYYETLRKTQRRLGQ